MAVAVPIRHLLLAVLVVAVWGSNFVVIKAGLDHLPPLLFAALRFTFAFLPAVLFIARPNVGWRNLAFYGLFIGVGQFGLLYLAINGHISPGLASLVAQTNAFFTIALAMILSGERVRAVQVFALLLAIAGIGVIMSNTDGDTTPLGLGLVLLAALSWACGNIASKNAGQINMVAYVAWSSIFAVPPLLALSFIFESGQLEAVRTMTLPVWGAVLYQSWGNSLFGFAVWGWLMVRYPTASIAPLSLLVPVFGMGASALFLGEPLPAWKLTAAALVMGGLALNVFWPYLTRAFALPGSK
ncbi:MAG: EamA family transporter [Rhodospirillaceae bacterium]|nr:EamA family transporter [Rhodospirillaceae bacterium]